MSVGNGVLVSTGVRPVRVDASTTSAGGDSFPASVLTGTGDCSAVPRGI